MALKIGGVVVTRCEEVLVLPRSQGDDIPFMAKSVSINDEFEEKVPKPIPPMLTKKGGAKEPDLLDKDYLNQVSQREEKRFALMCLRSLEPSNIEWEKVDIDKPGTWLKWTDELQENGISETEVNRVINLVSDANALSERKIQAARENFLRGREA
jgi:hypothetical protein